MLLRMMMWIKDKWKAIGVGLVGLVGFFAVMSRFRLHKDILKNANDAHKKEDKINSIASKETEKSSEDINNKLIEDLDESRAKHSLKNKSIQKSKKEFEKKSKNDTNLAKDIADHLGADFVKNNK